VPTDQKESALDKKYKYISDETKNRIGTMDVVLPSVYSAVFADVATKEHIDLEREERLASEMLDEKINQFSLLNEKTSSHVNRLSMSASKAVDAMEARNQSLLEEVLAETRALRAEVDALKSAVYEDPLTKVHNRKWFNDNYLTDENKLFKRSGVLALIDLNYFKDINDMLGHVSGDKVLVFIAGQLKRAGAQVVRYGGDEFVLFFDDETQTKEAHKKLHIIRELVMKKTLKVQDHNFKTSFSYGTVVFNEGDLLERVIDAADKAMYVDKEKIKERITPPF
jgi:diguanylate cyclase (GGDEF)-like protein